MNIHTKFDVTKMWQAGEEVHSSFGKNSFIKHNRLTCIRVKKVQPVTVKEHKHNCRANIVHLN